MRIDIWHAIYIITMILLAFSAALVITKTLGKYFAKEKEKEK